MYYEEVFAFIPLGQCRVIDTVFMCMERWSDLVLQVNKADDVCEIVSITV